MVRFETLWGAEFVLCPLVMQDTSYICWCDFTRWVRHPRPQLSLPTSSYRPAVV